MDNLHAIMTKDGAIMDALIPATAAGRPVTDDECYWHINMSRTEGHVELSLKLWWNAEGDIFGGSTVVLDAPPDQVQAWLEANGIETVFVAPILQQ